MILHNMNFQAKAEYFINSFFFQILDFTMRFYRTSVVYLHHEGQFRSQDTDTKIQAKYGQKLFLDSRHSVSLMYSMVLESINLNGIYPFL